MAESYERHVAVNTARAKRDKGVKGWLDLVAELEDRRIRRQAAFALADALDLCREIPNPLDLERVKDAGWFDAGWFNAIIGGDLYTVRVRGEDSEVHAGDGASAPQVQNPLDEQ